MMKNAAWHPKKNTQTRTQQQENDESKQGKNDLFENKMHISNW